MLGEWIICSIATAKVIDTVREIEKFPELIFKN